MHSLGIVLVCKLGLTVYFKVLTKPDIRTLDDLLILYLTDSLKCVIVFSTSHHPSFHMLHRVQLLQELECLYTRSLL